MIKPISPNTAPSMVPAPRAGAIGIDAPAVFANAAADLQKRHNFACQQAHRYQPEVKRIDHRGRHSSHYQHADVHEPYGRVYSLAGLNLSRCRNQRNVETGVTRRLRRVWL